METFKKRLGVSANTHELRMKGGNLDTILFHYYFRICKIVDLRANKGDVQPKFNTDIIDNLEISLLRENEQY